ncbi:MAG: SIMPL domain-containing protein [Chloroflexi bacterium]|nr:SIMPL domain-containing protein [Chloroflexota bacterium]
MLKKNLLLIVLVLAATALILAGCNGTTAVVPSYGNGATAAGLSVNGRGQVVLPPDVAYVTIGVHTEATDVSQAVQENADQVAAVMASLSEAGVAPEDMQTSNFSVYTMDNYDPLTGLVDGKKYSVDNTVNVTARDLANMGELLDSAISAGANSIWGVTFDLENKDTALAQARDMAVEDAKSEAQALASATEVTLGDIISVSYTDTGYYYPPYYGLGGGGGGAQAGAATSIVPGQITVSAEVYITYAIQ